MIAAAGFERPPKAPWVEVVTGAAAQWLPRLGAWFAEHHPIGWSAEQLQPVPVRRSSPRREVVRRGDRDGYSSDW